jgi:hypothetical protein
MSVSYKEAIKLLAEQDRLKKQYESYDNILTNLVNHTNQHGTHKETAIVYDTAVINYNLNILKQRITEIENIINE